MPKHFCILIAAGLLVTTGMRSTARAALSSGELFISDDNGIEKYDFQTATLSNLVPDNSNPGSFMGLAVGPNGNLLRRRAGAGGAGVSIQPEYGGADRCGAVCVFCRDAAGTRSPRCEWTGGDEVQPN